jgi:hypothetical protein
MPLDSVAASDPQSAHSASERGRVLVLACGTSPSGLPEAALAALASADVVFHDADINPAMLALIPSGAFVEPVSSGGDRASARTAAIVRADKLSAEGWRVVWLICGSDEPAPGKFAASGDRIGREPDPWTPEPQAVSAGRHNPRSLATAFNGLAG